MTGHLETRWMGRMEFSEALLLQNACAAALKDGGGPEVLILLEHEPVFTIGRTRDRSSLGATGALPFPVHEINRGGQATYHGPGQLVGYPILDLHRHAPDLHRYLRFLEDVVIESLAHFGITGGRRDGLTGVWVDDRKIAAIGIGVRHWITEHGFALNVSGDLEGFNHIVPCGIRDASVTSIERESGLTPGVDAVAGVVGEIFRRRLAGGFDGL